MIKAATEFHERMTSFIPNASLQTIKNLKKNGIIKIGAEVKNEEILIGKIKISKKENELPLTRFLNEIFNKKVVKDISIKSPPGITGIITKVNIEKKNSAYSISLFLTEKRKIQLGDKIAGRHGNKGIISKILPQEDMPYLPDGTPLDMILNPLGIPSRMNIGQIFESLLTLAAIELNEKYKILPFDEIQKKEISKAIIFEKLNEARIKTRKRWLFNPYYPGKIKLFDGRTGESFQQPVLVGYAYMLKLMHVAKEKLHSRLTGPYSLILKQPLRGKARNGGQRFGEMEVWAIEGFGAAYNLQELLTIKSDDIKNRSQALFAILKGKTIPEPNIPESFKTLIVELQALCLEFTIFSKKEENF